MGSKLNKKEVAVVVVTYNRKELLKEALDAIAHQNYKNIKVIVADNASTDGTKEYISDVLQDNRFLYFNTGANLGGAGGFNFGMKEAVKLSSDYIWIMDDDCIVHKDSLEALLNFAEDINDDFGYLSSVVRWKDGSICKMNNQKINLKTRVEDFETNGQKIMLASFVSLFMKRSVVEELGLPIKDFFIWGDDWEYTSRIAKKYSCYLVTTSTVTHKSNNNLGVDISRDTSDRLDRYFYAYRNEGYFYKKVGIKGRLYYFLKKWLHRFRILKSKAPNKKKKLQIMNRGLKAVRKFNPSIEYVYGPDREIKVLEFFGEPLLYGGQEAFMINMYKNFERSNIHYTFCTPFESGNTTLIKMAEERGDEIVAYNYKFESKLRKASIKKAAKAILSKNKFDVIHIQSGSIFTLLNVSKIAKKYGVKKVIIHSHCTGNKNFKYRLIKAYSDKKIAKYVDEYFACSDLAAEWKFPKDIIDDKKYTIIKNGLNLDKFKFNDKTREKYRKEFGITDELVICNVGRFAYEKNHKFMLELAKELNKNYKFRFILVGSGSLRDEVIETVKNEGLVDKFIFLEKRNDIAEIMMASDIFVLPSLFEGLPVTLVEAQSTGIVSLASDTITTETILTDICWYLPITEVNPWLKKIDEIKDIKVDRSIYTDKVAEAGYDASESAKLLEDKYLGVK